ncbi:MAG: N-acetylneuraminate synthase family protein [Deltaproteobacteria bacterium]|nr:N-acetylneuraminate synthase family protein [Deltaproteobacteria bacterium]
MQNKIFIIAEAAQGYEGSLEKAKLLLKGAIASGADAFKIQIFATDELARHDYKYFSLFQTLEMPMASWAELIHEAKSNGLKFYADVFGLETAQKLHELKVDGYKIHCSDVSNPPLLEFLSKTGASLLLSCGGSTLEEIENALKILSNGISPVSLLTGFQGEPSPLEETHLNRIRFLAEKFGLPVGLQDHVEGGCEESFLIPYMAIGAGAAIIEKHITLSRLLQMEDYGSALTPEEFQRFVKTIRTLEVAVGVNGFELSAKENQYRTLMKKHVVAKVDLNPGTVLSYDNMALKRTAENNVPLFSSAGLVGKKTATVVKKDQIILPEMLS